MHSHQLPQLLQAPSRAGCRHVMCGAKGSGSEAAHGCGMARGSSNKCVWTELGRPPGVLVLLCMLCGILTWWEGTVKPFTWIATCADGPRAKLLACLSGL